MTTLIIGILFFSLLGTVIYKTIKQHKKGERNCGCGCGSCPSSKSCSRKYKRAP